MKKIVSLVLAVTTILAVTAAPALAQGARETTAADLPEPYIPSFFTIVVSGGLLGVLNWLGILIWALLALPLGILSVVHSVTTKTRQMPLCTKLLACGGGWALVLGLTGAVQGTLGAFSTIATVANGAAQAAMLALNVSQALYSAGAALLVLQHYLFFFVISIILLHFTHRKLMRNS